MAIGNTASMSSVQAWVMLAVGVMFLTALLTGIWKWRHMLNSDKHQAPYYVDIAHRSALMYSFAGLLIWHFVGWSAWADWVNGLAAGALLFFFLTAIATYIRLGFANETQNQFEQRDFNTTWGMWALLVGEVSGFLVLFAGALKAAFSG